MQEGKTGAKKAKIAYNTLMTIKETIFQPIIFPERSDLKSVQKAVRSYTGTPLITWYKSPGRYDITDLRWNNPSHEWSLTVRSNGTGILRIDPTVEDAAIAQLGIPGEFLQVSTVLQQKSRPAVLMGNQYVVGGTRHVIFKMLEYVRD
jgi:hypothetical protein